MTRGNGTKGGKGNGEGRAISHHILIVEDNPDGREALRTLLETWGYEVDVAEDGGRGLALAQERCPAVALIDIGLPGVDGYQLARQVRAIAGCEKSVLVALTGYGQPDDRRRALEAGFDAHLVKPVDPDELARLLKTGRGDAS